MPLKFQRVGPHKYRLRFRGLEYHIAKVDGFLTYNGKLVGDDGAVFVGTRGSEVIATDKSYTVVKNAIIHDIYQHTHPHE